MFDNPGRAVGILIMSLTDSEMYFRFRQPSWNHLRTFSGARHGRNPGLWNFDNICHTFGDLSSSGLDDHVAIPGCQSMSHFFLDAFFEFAVVENFAYTARIFLQHTHFASIRLYKSTKA